MAYCINPDCRDRANPEPVACCQACGTPLLFHNRYRIINTLRQSANLCRNDLYEIEDLQSPGQSKVLKVLKDARPEVIAFFQREKAILDHLNHPGIPRGEDYFQVVLPTRTLRCLVMEKVPGVDLAAYVQTHGPISQTLARDWLAQIAQILAYLHRQKHFHRDIKPSNLILRPDGQLVLIDFGAAREFIADPHDGHTITVIGTLGYSAPEQVNGKATPQSDIYALGQTFVHLLTGVNPRQAPEPWWQGLKPSPLTELITQMICLDHKQRPASPLAVLAGLNHWRRSRRLKIAFQVAGLTAGLGLLGGGAVHLGQWWPTARSLQSPAPLVPVCDLEEADNLSCGEESLLPPEAIPDPRSQELQPAPPEKLLGMQQWQQGQLTAAIRSWEIAWSKQPDPETLIYLNNAKAAAAQAQNPGLRLYKIAIVSTLKDSKDENSIHPGLELLRGMAQIQTEAAEAGIYLQVLIANDENKPATAKAIARRLAQRDILLTIGHFASEVTLQVLEIYQTANLPLLSGTSTSAELTQRSQDPHHVFFRTVPSTLFSARALVNHLTQHQAMPRVAVFFNPDVVQGYSPSLKTKFTECLMGRDPDAQCPRPANGGTVESLDIGKSQFKPTELLVALRTRGTTALALFPTGRTKFGAFQNAIDLINANQGTLPMVGSNTLIDWKTLQQPLEYVKNLVVVTHWSKYWRAEKTEHSTFWPGAQKLWGNGDATSWRTAMIYDVGKVIVTALEQLGAKAQQPITREQLRQQLSQPDFVAFGATGKISFEGSDRRQQQSLIQLVKIRPLCPESSNSTPIPTPTPTPVQPVLDFVPIEFQDNGCPPSP